MEKHPFPWSINTVMGKLLIHNSYSRVQGNVRTSTEWRKENISFIFIPFKRSGITASHTGAYTTVDKNVLLWLQLSNLGYYCYDDNVIIRYNETDICIAFTYWCQKLVNLFNLSKVKISLLLNCLLKTQAMLKLKWPVYFQKLNSKSWVYSSVIPKNIFPF